MVSQSHIYKERRQQMMPQRKTYEDQYNVERLITRRRIADVSNDIDDHKVSGNATAMPGIANM